MKLRFVSANLHGAGDYAAASALIAAPFNLPIGTHNAIAHWLTIVMGVGLIVYSLLTDYAFGLKKLIPFRIHMMFDSAAFVVFAAAPLIFDFTGIDAQYYYGAALSVLLIVLVTDAKESESDKA